MRSNDHLIAAYHALQPIRFTLIESIHLRRVELERGGVAHELTLELRSHSRQDGARLTFHGGAELTRKPAGAEQVSNIRS